MVLYRLNHVKHVRKRLCTSLYWFNVTNEYPAHDAEYMLVRRSDLQLGVWTLWIAQCDKLLLVHLVAAETTQSSPHCDTSKVHLNLYNTSNTIHQLGLFISVNILIHKGCMNNADNGVVKCYCSRINKNVVTNKTKPSTINIWFFRFNALNNTYVEHRSVTMQL